MVEYGPYVINTLQEKCFKKVSIKFLKDFNIHCLIRFTQDFTREK